MKQSDSYDRSIHRTGRLGSILAIAWMLGIPAVMCTVYHMFPSIPDLLLFGSGLLALYVPTAISEVITYVPMLGSASYITFITGNISNLKLPCALNALEMADVEQNTDAGDAVATVAVAVSSIVTTVIIQFYWKWDDYMGPLLYLSRPQSYTVSIAIKLFADSASTTDYGAMFAMSTLSLIPVFLIFLFFNRYLVQGIGTSGLKG